MQNQPSNFDQIPNLDAASNIDRVAHQIAELVSANIQVKIALISAGAAILGSLIPVLGSVIMHFLPERKSRAQTQRKNILKKMLEVKKFEWRKLSTLASVIGAPEDATRDLLLEIGARRSESDQDVWALISRKPLADIHEK